MYSVLRVLGVWAATAVLGCSTPNPWAKVATPARGNPSSIGGYAAGCIGGAVPLKLDGLGYQVMRPSRNRFYGHPRLVEFVERFAAQVDGLHMGPLLIGDLGQPRGGPMPTGHRSHQIGLDVDIWFWHPVESKESPLTPDQRETLSSRSVLASTMDELNKTVWKPELMKLLELAASDPETDRVFVTPAVKRELCIQYQGRGKDGWLHKIRPWWGHDDHFHVRLKCATRDLGQCQTQEAIPPGDGCDETLNWWFSQEAKDQAKAQSPSQTPTMPKLPDACQALIKQP